MTVILSAILTISILGLIFGLGLAIGSRIFAVKTDPRLEKIEELLPQLNCGACGYGGCADCARGLLDGKSEPSVCPVAPPDSLKEIAELLGRMLEEEDKLEARIFCRGGHDAARRYHYEGIKTCAAANQLGGGSNCLRLWMLTLLYLP